MKPARSIDLCNRRVKAYVPCPREVHDRFLAHQRATPLHRSLTADLRTCREKLASVKAAGRYGSRAERLLLEGQEQILVYQLGVLEGLWPGDEDLEEDVPF